MVLPVDTADVVENEIVVEPALVDVPPMYPRNVAVEYVNDADHAEVTPAESVARALQ
jgi:hypothetical protein